jgi:hypothetical protein
MKNYSIQHGKFAPFILSKRPCYRASSLPWGIRLSLTSATEHPSNLLLLVITLMRMHKPAPLGSWCGAGIGTAALCLGPDSLTGVHPPDDTILLTTHTNRDTRVAHTSGLNESCAWMSCSAADPPIAIEPGCSPIFSWFIQLSCWVMVAGWEGTTS